MESYKKWLKPDKNVHATEPGLDWETLQQSGEKKSFADFRKSESESMESWDIYKRSEARPQSRNPATRTAPEFSIMDWIKQLFTPKITPGPGGGMGFSTFGTPTTQRPGAISAIGNNGSASTQAMTTRLNINIDSKISLIVDGRQMANVVKSYIMQDLVRAGGSVGQTITHTIV